MCTLYEVKKKTVSQEVAFPDQNSYKDVRGGGDLPRGARRTRLIECYVLWKKIVYFDMAQAKFMTFIYSSWQMTIKSGWSPDRLPNHDVFMSNSNLFSLKSYARTMSLLSICRRN